MAAKQRYGYIVAAKDSSPRIRRRRRSSAALSLLYCWPSVRWCVGLIKEANGDRRFKIEGEVVNFFIHYEVDDNTSRHVLKFQKYGGGDEGSWVLLEALA